MKFLKIEDEFGDYKDKEDNKYSILICKWAKGPRADEFVKFQTLQDALDFWKLIPINPEPVEEIQEVENGRGNN